MSISKRRLGLAAALCVCSLLGGPGEAGAATRVYPSGGSGFNGGAEGWTPGATSCSPAALLCSSEAAYDASVGNPPGSIAAKTTVTANALGLFKGTATWESPRFVVPVGAVTGVRVRLDRAFDPGGLVDLEPKATYTVTLSDLDADTSSVPLTEEVTKDDSTFAARSGSASVVSGDAYRLTIEAVTAQSTAAASALSGTTALRFDNVGLLVETAGGSGGGGGKGGGGAGAKGGAGGSGSSTGADARLAAALGSSVVAPATVKGRRLYVRARCPKRVGRACRISLQGMLAKRRPATTKRRVKVGKGRTKRVALRLKRRARGKLNRRKRLLFKVALRAGPAHAAGFKHLRLIRR